MAVNNLANYQDKDGLGFPLNFRRGNPNPLDNSSVWASLADAQNYAQTSPVAYVGQVLTVVDAENNTATVYSIQNVAGDLSQVGSVTLGDDVSIEKDADGKLSIKGFAEAAAGAQPRKKADGTIEWIKPDTTTVEGLETAVQGLQNDVDDIRADVDTNTDAIAVLNGDNTKPGSVAYQIAQILAGAPESYDTLKEIADWIATHGTDAATMNSSISQNTSDITALEGLVGDTAVATQIANAINEALKSGETDKYALAADLTTLAGRVSTNEADISSLKAKVGETSVSDQIDAALKVDGEEKYALKSHNHTVLEVTGLQEALNSKADATALSTLQSDVDGLEAKAHEHTNKTLLDAITEEKVQQWDAAQANVIEGITLAGATAAITNKMVEIPAATATALGVVKVDDTSIQSTAGVIGIKAVDINKVFVPDDTELVLDAGKA